MAFKYNQLVLPFALWSGSIPVHNISCALFVKKDRIATGSETGVICLWQKQNGSLHPEFLLSGHDSLITTLVSDVYAETECLVSISQDGTICLWDITDGLCLKASDKNFVNFSPTSMTSMGNNRHVIVSGRADQAIIIDVIKMKIEVRAANHDNWVTGVFPCTMQTAENEFIFLSLCKGILRFWLLTEERSLDAIQTIVLDMENLQSIVVCPNNTTFIAISSDSWGLFSASNSHCIQQIRCPYDCGWAGGAYVDSYHPILWTSDGHACLYRIPDISKHHPMDFGHGSESIPSSPSPNLEYTVLMFTFTMGEEKLLHTKTSMLGSEIVTCCSEDGSSLCFADERGNLHLFDIPLHQLVAEMEPNHTPIRISGGDMAKKNDTISYTEATVGEEITPKTCGSIRESWEGLPAQGEEYQEQEQLLTVTTSQILADSFTLIYGYSNGDITLQQLPLDENPRILPQCHQGKVTALMKAVTSDHSNILISGGEDCLIHEWDLSTGDKLRTWPQHCGTILQLLPLPQQTEVFESQGLFLSISSDFSIGLFSYDPPKPKAINMFSGHKAPIVSVQLRLDQDYLFVTCEDETVTIWELSTGEYEGCYPADSLREITQMAMEQLSLKDNQTIDLQTEIQSSLTLYSSDSTPRQPCADILLLNIRQIIEETHRRAQFNLDADIPQTLQYYSFLIPWGLSHELDSLVISLGIHPPSGFQALSPGIYGDKGKLTIFVPNSSNSYARFKSSNRTTAVFLLSTLAFTDALLQTATRPEMKTICSQLVSQFGALLPEQVDGFMDPCLGYLTNFWRDKTMDIQQSARSLFFSTLDRKSIVARNSFLQKWARRMEVSDRHNIKSKAIPGLLLGIVIADRPEFQVTLPENQLPEKIATSLTRLILGHPEISFQLLAAETLARGFTVWGNFISAKAKIFQKLLSVTTPSAPGKLSASEKALFTLAVKMPDHFVTTVSDLSKVKTFSQSAYISALKVTNKLVKRCPFTIVENLTLLIEFIIRSINPKLPYRGGTLKLSNSILMLIVSTYPMVSYDADTQRLVVGTTEKVIRIYDLKLCSRLYTLTGHTCPIDAVSFSSDGKNVASFSCEECLVCFWSCGSSSLWFNSPPRCLKGLVVTDVVDKNLSKPEFLSNLSLEWISASNVRLINHGKSTILSFT